MDHSYIDTVTCKTESMFDFFDCFQHNKPSTQNWTKV